ncbi:flagellar export protein FliJ [Terasakiella sp. A23]|uniref:flagellar export protein FliJ n=1 Tax=Terasakiella sp. FCG-A23 TaxID=3080561 RepID=UPI0029547B4E|nr:flagellar export protein FliJ [Terasakiella sp. A23]MDV7338998.1 flagellar export protein FliJ [Terasakiella sp. A23]
MGKTLENLIRLHKYRVDEKRRTLGVLFGELNDLEQKLKDLYAQIANEQEIAQSSPEQAMFSYGRFHQRAMLIRDEIVQAIAAKEEEVNAAREEVNEAFRELKVYEEAEKKRKKKEDEERQRKENIEMDEIAMNLHRRNHDS